MIPAQSTAEQIGIERIGAVVSEFYERVQRHHTLSKPFSVVTDWPEHKEHLTYFWWTVLGGKKYREIPFNVVPKHVRAGFSADLLEDWKALFADVVSEYVPEPLATEWLEKVRSLGISLLLANSRQLVLQGQGRGTF